MAVKIIGLIIGILVLGAGLYYLSKEKHDPKRSIPSSALWAGSPLPCARRCCFSERALPKGRKAKRRDFGHAAFSNAKGFLLETGVLRAIIGAFLRAAALRRGPGQQTFAKILIKTAGLRAWDLHLKASFSADILRKKNQNISREGCK